MGICIGSLLSERMKLLNINIETLAHNTFIDDNVINSIINDEKSLDDIDEFDLALISDALHCSENYFTDENVRKNDFLTATMNRGTDSQKSIKIKSKISDYMNDFVFLSEIYNEIN